MAELRILNTKETIKVNNVYCVGKNYIDHIKELKDKDSKPEIPAQPVIFMKPNTSVTCGSSVCKIPVFNNKPISGSLQNEVELVIVIDKDGVEITTDKADDYIFGYCVGIDFTLRDVQTKLKEKGLPWTLSKGFLLSAPVSEVLKKGTLNPGNLDITLKVNNQIRQKANTSQMIFNVQYLVHYISSIFGIQRGDIIFTGTPSGISDLKTGDKIIAELSGVGVLEVDIING